MKIEVLGFGCPTCKKLHETVLKIVKEEKIVFGLCPSRRSLGSYFVIFDFLANGK